MQEVVQIRGNFSEVRTYINDNEGNNLFSSTFDRFVGNVPIFTFCVCGKPELAVDNANIRLKHTPNTVGEAAEMLRHELLTNACVYDAFHASILSAIQEAPSDCNECELATRILDRIVGRD